MKNYLLALFALLLAACGRAEAATETVAVTVPLILPCGVASLKGTYAFDGLGFAPQPPAPIPPYPVNLGGSFTIADIGASYFDGLGHSVGFTSECIGGVQRENDTPFEGTYELHRGPHGEGCTGTWTLQDHHTLPPFDTEPPHIFKISLSRAAKGFHYTVVGGGPGPAALSGFATLDVP